MATSTIEWTDATWNPVRGCTKISPGCKRCYAETFAERFRGVPGHPYEQGFDLRLVPSKLTDPLTWRKSRRVFVNSMSDLFHKDVPDDYIDQVFGVMMACALLENRRHTFQVLTKRPERMWAYLAERMPRSLVQAWAKAGDGLVTMDNEDILFSEIVMSETAHDWDEQGTNSSGSEYRPWGYLKRVWPLPNVWLGVSVEDRKYGLPRIDYLRRVPAAVRFLSIEPLLEDLGEINLAGIDWVIVGGESAGDADRRLVRGCSAMGVAPDHADCPYCSGTGWEPTRDAWHWVTSIRDQCLAAKVAFLFKQWGGPKPKSGGRVLDGRAWDEYPN